ncbi:hypothetical protein CONLIGDRAFT_665362 [Coniochaeta ligniaria NRRL 30616]|uniref:DUF6590 domain-containing protein n=1 Tax=Coniochaeta ligniaria NRRL 30616 TaxID=1408157 RepID=A0A1J7K3A4_9PEZI|nr:hypothetical protein CONLIGDRAFT_665362 [Coniochaeta ligniaria NRRL 30616]
MASAAQTQSRIIPKLIFPSLLTRPTPLDGTPSSHDISSAGYHVTQSALLLQLDHAVKASWTSRHQSKYTDVKVLLLSWDSDDLGVDREISVLESVFKDAYHYDDVQHWKIPDKRPGHEASARIARFLERGGDADNLLIVYYAGHAMPNVNHGLPTWFANRQPNSPKLNSSMIQDYLCEVDDASPDILFLYDTCHSANGHGSIESSRSAIALLAACGFESVAAEIGHHSFTYALIQELSEAARQQKAISVPQLHSSMLTRLHLQRQDVLLQERDGNMCIRTTNNGIPLFESPVWRTPIYIQLSQNTRPRPIMLAPLPGRSTSPNDPDFIVLNARPASTDTYARPKKARMHVLLRGSLAEDSFNIEEFKDWICEAPEPAKEIKIIHTLPSCSTLILLEMPVELWDMLPASPAISFVGFVTVDESETSPGSTPDNIKPVSGDSTQESIATNTITTSFLPGPSHKPKKGVTFDSTSDDEKSIIAILDCVDSILPALFQEIRQRTVQSDALPEVWIAKHVADKLEQFAKLPTCAFDLETVVLQKNATLVKNYIGARHLLEHDNPLLNLTWRLNPLFSWRNDDAEVPDDQATILTDADSRRSDPRLAGSIFSDTRTVETSATSITDLSHNAHVFQGLRQPLDGDAPDWKPKVDEKEMARGRGDEPNNNRSRSHSQSRSPTASVAVTTIEGDVVPDMVKPFRNESADRAGSKSHSRSQHFTVTDTSAVRTVDEATELWHDRKRTKKGKQRKRDQYIESYGVTNISAMPRLLAKDNTNIGESYGQTTASHHNNEAEAVDGGDPWATATEFQEEAMPYPSADEQLAAVQAYAELSYDPNLYDYQEGLTDYEPHEVPFYEAQDDPHYRLANQRGYISSESTEDLPGRSEQGYHVRETYWSSLPADQAAEEAEDPGYATPTAAEHIGQFEAFDARYRVEPSRKFKPGEIFKILWSEPQGLSKYRGRDTGRVDMESLSERRHLQGLENLGEGFYVGFRRFIVIAADETDCTCVPILTYFKQGCTKRGVKASKHGIVHEQHTNPKLVKGEPEMGFRPIRMAITAPGERLARESRVNYSKLVTVEHNVKVFFIGSILDEDFDEIVPRAVDKCWSGKRQKRVQVQRLGAI